MGGAEADRGRARADVKPVVVRVGDAEVVGVLGGVGVGVPDEGGFPVVVEEGAGWEGGLAGVGRRGRKWWRDGGGQGGGWTDWEMVIKSEAWVTSTRPS